MTAEKEISGAALQEAGNLVRPMPVAVPKTVLPLGEQNATLDLERASPTEGAFAVAAQVKDNATEETSSRVSTGIKSWSKKSRSTKHKAALSTSEANASSHENSTTLVHANSSEVNATPSLNATLGMKSGIHNFSFERSDVSTAKSSHLKSEHLVHLAAFRPGHALAKRNKGRRRSHSGSSRSLEVPALLQTEPHRSTSALRHRHKSLLRDGVGGAGPDLEYYRRDSSSVDNEREEESIVGLRDAAYFNMADGVCMARWEYGLLVGYGFAIVFALGSAVAGYICDRKPRVAVASVAVCVWSVALSMQASAHTFTFLFICRGVIGLAQAFAMPACISIAADYFPERQSAAEVVLSLGLYLGSGSASFSILLAEDFGWRWVVLLAGLAGLLVAALLYFTVQEPERSEWSAPCTQAVVTYEVFDKSRVARMLLMAAAAKMLAAYSLSAFLPLWYSRSGLIGYTSSRYAVWNMLAISVGGVLSAIVGGWVSNIWSRRDPRAPCWVGVFGSLASMPLICVVIRTSYFSASISCFFLLLVVSESWFGPTVGLLQASVRRSVRGQAVSMFLVASTLVAYIGPAIVGFLDPGDADVGTSLLWVALLANAVSVVAFTWTAREVGVDPVAADAGYKFEAEAQVARSQHGGKQALIPPRGTTPWFFF